MAFQVSESATLTTAPATQLDQVRRSTKGTLSLGASVAMILAFAFAIRIAAMVATGAAERGATNAYEHDSVARAIVGGQGFSFIFLSANGELMPTSHQAPLLPYVVAASYVLFGPGTVAAAWFVLVIQASVASLGVLALARVAAMATGRESVGWLTAFIAACYPPLAIASAHIQAVSWNLALLALAMWGAMLLVRGHTKAGVPLFVASSLAAWHVDPIIGATTVVVLASQWFVPRSSKRWLVTCVMLVGIGMLPWMARNYAVHGRVVVVKDTFWYVFWQGNTAQSGGTDKIPLESLPSTTGNPLVDFRIADAVRQECRSIDSTLPPNFLAHLQTLRSEIERMDAFKAQILRELTVEQYLRKCLRRLKIWFWFDDTNPRSFVPAYRVCYLGLVFFALIGMLRHPPTTSAWLAILAAALFLTVVHALIITSARFRLPYEMLLLPFAAVALADLLHFARSLRPAPVPRLSAA